MAAARAGYLPALTDRLDFWTIDGNAVRWLGVALYAVGAALRLWPVYVLGNRFSAGELEGLQQGARKRLAETQRTDGGWDSAEGPNFDVNTTLTVLRAASTNPPNGQHYSR